MRPSQQLLPERPPFWRAYVWQGSEKPAHLGLEIRPPAVAAGDASFLERLCLAAGDASALAAGDSAVAALSAGEAAFLERLCLPVAGDASALAAGDSAVAALSAGEAAFLECLCLAAGDASGTCGR